MAYLRALKRVQQFVLLYYVLGSALSNETYKEKRIPTAFKSIEDLNEYMKVINTTGKFVIELSGIPESDEEDTLEAVRRYGRLIGVKDSELGNSARRIHKWIPEAPGPRIIVAEVPDVNATLTWATASNTHRNITSEDLEKSAPRTEIYVNEYQDLGRCPPDLLQLLYNVTRMVAPYGYNKVYIKKGAVYVTQRGVRGPSFIVRTAEHLSRLVQGITQFIPSSYVDDNQTDPSSTKPRHH